MNFVANNLHFIINCALLCFLIVISIAIIKSRNLINSTLLFAVFSMLMAAEYMLLAAPDVAITEASVGAGISSILFLLAIFLVGEKEKRIKTKKILPLILILSVMALLIYACKFLPPFGASNAIVQTRIAPYFINNSIAETGVTNVVTSVLASYRGYDTFGETIVIFTAAIAVYMLLTSFSTKKKV